MVILLFVGGGGQQWSFYCLSEVVVSGGFGFAMVIFFRFNRGAGQW